MTTTPCPKHPIRKRPKDCATCAANLGFGKSLGHKPTVTDEPRPSVPQRAIPTEGRRIAHHVKCPKCGRAYVELFYKPHAQKPTYRCSCIGHPLSHPPERKQGGCGHEWTPKT